MFMGAYLSLAFLCHPSARFYEHRLLLLPALLSLPPTIMYSRIRLGVHTVAQCAVGGTLGLLTAVSFTALWQGWGIRGGGLRGSSWVREADEYITIAQELLVEWWQ